MNSFETFWSGLLKNLKVVTTIKNWTAYGGYLGDTMTIAGVGKDDIEADPPNAVNIQVVPKDDFETVWNIWADYKRQKVRRYELRDLTRFSKYIISILHWYEDI